MLEKFQQLIPPIMTSSHFYLLICIFKLQFTSHKHLEKKLTMRPKTWVLFSEHIHSGEHFCALPTAAGHHLPTPTPQSEEEQWQSQWLVGGEVHDPHGWGQTSQGSSPEHTLLHWSLLVGLGGDQEDAILQGISKVWQCPLPKDCNLTESNNL